MVSGHAIAAPRGAYPFHASENELQSSGSGVEDSISLQRARTIWMGGIRPDWDIHFVEGLFRDRFPVECVTIKRNALKGWIDAETGCRVGFALIRFFSQGHADSVINTLCGQPIPDTNTIFDLKPNRWSAPSSVRSLVAATGEELPPPSTEQCCEPTLQQQLEPLTMTQIRQRLGQFGITDTAHREQEAQRTGGRVAKKEMLKELLCECHQSAFPRQQLYAKGQPVPMQLVSPLLEHLQQLVWPPKKRNVCAQEYLVLGVPADGAKPKLTERYAQLWELCGRLMQGMACEFQFSSVAVTKNFVASPHCDMGDKTFQYAISLGDFTDGGELCVESSPQQVVVVNTKNRLAKVDGRYPHWVSPFRGERYSLIFYRVTGQTTPMERAVYATAF